MHDIRTGPINWAKERIGGRAMRFLIAATFAALLTGPVGAETKVGVQPQVGVERTVTAGSAIFEKYRYEVARLAFAQFDAVRGTLTGDIRVSAGEPLHQVDSNARFKACMASGPCGLDDDGDGKFDRVSLDEVVGALKLKAPVPYELREVPIQSTNGNFRQIIIYLGANSDTLRLSYREFSNDMSRPAFTEELTFPISKSFPQKIAFKDIRATLLGIDGEGL